MGYLLKWPNLGSSDIQFRLENRIHEEQIGEQSQGPQKHELSKKKKSWWLWNPKPTHHKPTKPPKPQPRWDPSVSFFLLGGGGKGVNLLFLFERSFWKTSGPFLVVSQAILWKVACWDASHKWTPHESGEKTDLMEIRRENTPVEGTVVEIPFFCRVSKTSERWLFLVYFFLNPWRFQICIFGKISRKNWVMFRIDKYRRETRKVPKVCMWNKISRWVFP